MTPDVITLVSGRIRQLRRSGGWSQESFAEHAGIERAYYGRVETGKINLTIKTLHKIAVGLDQPLGALVSAEGLAVSAGSGSSPEVAQREAGSSIIDSERTAPSPGIPLERLGRRTSSRRTTSRLPIRAFG